MPVRSPASSSSRGQATPLVAIVLVLAALLLVPMALVARATIDRARAQSAADAAALAGAAAPDGGEAVARAVARANGARVLAWRSGAGYVEITVVVRDRRATARAERREIIVPLRRGTPR